MDLDTFRQRVLHWSPEQLEQVLVNVRQAQRPEHEAVVRDELERRRSATQVATPLGDAATHTPGASAPQRTKARIGREAHTFASVDDAFAWTVEQMIEQSQRPIEAILKARPGPVADELPADWLARSPQGPGRATTVFGRLSNGWYLRLSADTEQKKRFLFALADATGLEAVLGFEPT